MAQRQIQIGMKIDRVSIASPLRVPSTFQFWLIRASAASLAGASRLSV